MYTYLPISMYLIIQYSRKKKRRENSVAAEERITTHRDDVTLHQLGIEQLLLTIIVYVLKLV